MRKLAAIDRDDVLRYAADRLVLDSRAAGIMTELGPFDVTPARRQSMVLLARELYARLGEPSCKGCGCTEDLACEGGCGWTRPEWCSQCAPPSKPPPSKKRRKS